MEGNMSFRIEHHTSQQQHPHERHHLSCPHPRRMVYDPDLVLPGFYLKSKECSIYLFRLCLLFVYQDLKILIIWDCRDKVPPRSASIVPSI